jgi:flagellin-like hook-associated protein FlgL
MTTVDQIAAATGLDTILNRQQAKQAGLAKELASATVPSSIANALAVPFETETLTLPVVQKNIALAGTVLSTSEQALSSVSANLMQALAIASEALSAPPAAQSALALQYNALLNETKGFVDNATVNGLNLVGSDSKPMTVNTTTEGGHVTVANAPSDAHSLGVAPVPAAGWSSQAQIQQSIDQILSALNQITSAESKFAAVQSVLEAASQVNQSSALAASASAATLVSAEVGASVLDRHQSLTQVELSTYAGEDHLRHARNILGLLDK